MLISYCYSTDEDARQAMMLDGGKIKEIQVKLLLSSRSEMHKVIEAARQSVPILSLAPAPTPVPVQTPAPAPAPVIPALTPFSAALGNNSLSSFGIPGIGNPQEIPQPAVIEPPAPLISPTIITPEDDKDDEKPERKRSREKDRRRTRSRSRSRDRDRKDRKRDRRDRSRSRDRRRRDRSRSRDRRDRKRDRKDRSRSHERSPGRRSRDRRKSPRLSQEKISDLVTNDVPIAPPAPMLGGINPNVPPHLQQQMLLMNSIMPNGGVPNDSPPSRFNDPSMTDTFTKLQELGKKRNPNAFQGQQPPGGITEQQPNGGRPQGGRGGGVTGAPARGGPAFRRGERPSRFEGDCCVAIRNAPNHTGYGDVRRFFPFMIDKHGIKMINDNTGRRTGTIYVRFCDPRSKQLALQRKTNELKGAAVTVEALDDETYDAAVDSFLPYREDNDEEDTTLIIADDELKPSFSVLKLTDLPNFVKEHDIIKAFSEFSLLSIMVNDCRMTRSKIAYVQFVKSEDAKSAYEKKEKYMFGRRQPTITPVSNDDYEKEKMSQSEKVPDIKPAPKVAEPQPEVQGPRDPRQRRQQFDNGGPKNGPPGHQQGGSFFGAPTFGQQNPLQQNPMQQSFVPPFPAAQFTGFPGPAAIDPRTAAANWATRPGGPMNPNQMNPIQNQQGASDMEDEPLDCVLMKGLPRDATDRTIVTFLTDTGAVPARIHLMLDTNGAPSGDCFCEFRTTQEARMAATKHGHHLEGCRVTIDLVSRGVVKEALEGPKMHNEISEGLLGHAPPVIPQFFEAPRGSFAPRGSYRGRGNFDSNRGNFERGGFNRGGFDQGRGGYRGRGGFDRGGRGFDRGRGRGFGGSLGRGGGPFENGRDQMRHDEEDPALEDFGAPGCVVSMENVPFRASIEEIMTFFSEFELTQDDVIRRYNERGQPTGDARVAFRTPFDAQRAVKTRHMDTIHDRRISLTIL